MIRSAALTFSAVTLRLELPLLVASGLELPTAYATMAWLGWVPNLLAAEWILRGRPFRAKAPPAQSLGQRAKLRTSFDLV